MSLEIVLGSMFSGKTSEIIKYYSTYSLKYKTIIINHKSDNRYDASDVISTHNNVTLEAIKLNKLSDLEKNVYETSEFILIDESQFFPDLNEFVIKALNDDKYIVVVGLNGDCDLKPFMNLMNLIPYADKVKHLTSLCQYCKKPTPAFAHQRIDKTNKNKVAVGGASDYVVLCRYHYNQSVSS